MKYDNDVDRVNPYWEQCEYQPKPGIAKVFFAHTKRFVGKAAKTVAKVLWFPIVFPAVKTKQICSKIPEDVIFIVIVLSIIFTPMAACTALLARCHSIETEHYITQEASETVSVSDGGFSATASATAKVTITRVHSRKEYILEKLNDKYENEAKLKASEKALSLATERAIRLLRRLKEERDRNEPNSTCEASPSRV